MAEVGGRQSVVGRKGATVVNIHLYKAGDGGGVGGHPAYF